MVSITALTILPESPVWLFLQGREDKTVSTLQILRGVPADNKKIRDELSNMMEVKNMKSSESGEETNTFKELLKPEAYKPISLILAMFFFVNFSGANAILAFGLDLVRGFGFGEDVQYLPAIIMSSMRLIGTALGVFLLIPRLKRKTVVISTALVMLACHLGVALIMFLKDSSLITDVDARWGSMVLVSLYLLSFGSGAGTIPWSLAGELTSMKVY